MDIRGNAVGIDPVSGDLFGNMLDRPVWHAVRWSLSGGTWTRTRLRLPGPVPPPPADVITSLNTHKDGVSVGVTRPGNAGPGQAVMWSVTDGVLVDLQTGDGTEAYGHDGGRIVGTDETSGRWQGFLWTALDGVRSIHPVGWEWSLPNDTDSAGRIVGVVGMGDIDDPATERQIFLLTPNL